MTGVFIDVSEDELLGLVQDLIRLLLEEALAMTRAQDFAGIGQHTGPAMDCIAQLSLAAACGDGSLQVMFPEGFLALAGIAERYSRDTFSTEEADGHLDSYLLWQALARRVRAELAGPAA